jgi:UDP-2,3-diacylglucosamine pyrophosphatase LpxH
LRRCATYGVGRCGSATCTSGRAKADALLAFLDRHQCDYRYLVGDIVDFWQLRRTPYWPQIQTDVVRKVLSRRVPAPSSP